MTPRSGRPALRVVGKPCTPEEVSELLATVGAGISTMREILRLWDDLLQGAGALDEIRALSPAEVSAALEAQRRALGNRP